MLPKTLVVVVGSVSAIFLLLLHPLWNSWWVEESVGRRIGAALILAIACLGLGYFSWPTPIPDEFRANLHCQNIRIRTYQTPQLNGEPDGLGFISTTIVMQNIGRLSLVGQAITSAGLYTSERLRTADQLDAMFVHGSGHRVADAQCASLTPPNLSAGAFAPPIECRAKMILPEVWQQIKSGKILVYVVTESFFWDKYGRRRSQSCSYFGRGFPNEITESSCIVHNDTVDLH